MRRQTNAWVAHHATAPGSPYRETGAPIVMAERISRLRAESEGWLSAREVRDATGLGHATLIERFQNATRDGLRVARLENGEWRLHPEDLARIPRRYEARGAPRSKLEQLEDEVATLRERLARLEARVVGAPA